MKRIQIIDGRAATVLEPRGSDVVVGTQIYL